MKTFKQFLKEDNNSFKELNDIFLDYVNGDMPDHYENVQPNVKDLFRQIYELFKENGVNLIIVKDGKKFSGENIVVNTTTDLHFDLASENEDKDVPYKLHVEIRKKDDEGYFFSTVRIENK